MTFLDLTDSDLQDLRALTGGTPLDDTFEWKGHVYRVKELHTLVCKDCALKEYGICHSVCCGMMERPDEKNVTFEKIK